MLIDLSCPVENRGTIVKTNSETNEPYLLLKLFNLSEKKITSLKFTVSAFNSTGAELGKIPVELNDLSAEPKSYFAVNNAISLVDMEEAKHFVVDVESAVFEDGTSYEPSQAYTVYAEDKEAPVDDVIALREFVPEAVCFSKEHSSYWRCVCGRPNFPDSEICVRCERDKSEVLEIFNSRDSLEKYIEEKRIEEEQALAEEAERLAQIKELQKKKTIKALIISAIALAIAAVLAVAGFFIYRAVLNSNANKAFENGDYITAYNLFEKTGNEKIGELTQYVQGNTPENLMFQSGLITSDEKNIYYLALDTSTYSFNLVKEDKETKEKTVLTDAAGGSLNVNGEWIYFLDTENGYLKRIFKDGQQIENIIDTQATYLSVIGNTVYFSKTDYNNPNGLSEEQCQTLAAQGQMDMYNRLYKFSISDIGKEEAIEPKLVLEESIITCAIYGDRIYYLTDKEDSWEAYNLCSVNLDGKDKKVVVDVPVASFLIRNNKLYFVKMYNDSLRGQEIQDASGLDYSLYCMNLETGGVTSFNDEYLITYMNGNSDKLFFIAYNRDEYFAAQEATDQTLIAPSTSLYSLDYETGDASIMVAGDVQIFNVYNDDVIMYLSTNGMCRMKADGSGFEEIKVGSDGIITEEVPAEEETPAE